MSDDADVRTPPQSASQTPGRYISTRVEPSSPAFFCTGESVDQMRLSLQRSGERGRYRVYDRQPMTRGLDFELIGQFAVDATGKVEWTMLRSI